MKRSDIFDDSDAHSPSPMVEAMTTGLLPRR
jgi:hypothetical protein